MQAGNTGQYQLGLIQAKLGDASKRSPTAMDHSAFGNWLQESGLYKLPQLLNVIRGEMSLVGPRPYPLSSIGQIKPDHQQILNALPALIAPGSLKARSQSWEFQTRNLNVLCYFRQWSLWQDMKSLLSAIPQVWSALIP
jgi:lipopolysaccharide/colanic/teichoic acid biosynthesis glycosyltransferase